MSDQIVIQAAEDDLVVRRSLLALRRGWWIVLSIGVLVAAGAYYRADTSADRFRSQGALELTDNVASGINVRGARSDALLEIEAQRLRLESDEFLDVVRAAMGPSGDGLLSISATNSDDTPVLLINATAASPEVAELALDNVLAVFIETRVEAGSDRLAAELEVLQRQRDDQLTLIESLTGELAVARATGAPQDQISVLESRTAAALRRLEDYEVAIQEREFIDQSSSGQLRIVSASSPARSVGANGTGSAVRGGLVGLVVGLLAVLVFDRLRGRLLLLDEVRTISGPDIPILATVPRFRRELRSGTAALVVGRRNTRREAEAFRYLRTAIEVAAEGITPMVVAFTSANPNEGKTVTAANYALASSRAERSTALLDGDLLNSSTGLLFGVDAPNGFPGLLDGRIDPTTEEWFRVPTNGEPLDVLVTRRSTSTSARQELPTKAVEATFGKLAQIWETVVVDCPPVLAVSDAMVLARAADIAILIVRMGKTTKRDLDKALTQLEQNEVNIAGIVVTHSTDKSESYYGYGYGYERSGDGA